MKTYGNVLFFTPTSNAVDYGNVMNPEKNMIYKEIHSFKVQDPKFNYTQTATPDIVEQKTKAEKEDELRELMDLYYKVKINEMTATGQIQPAFQASPYTNDFNYIHNFSLDKKRSKLLAIQDWMRRTGKQWKPNAVLKTQKAQGNTQPTQANIPQTPRTNMRPRSNSLGSPSPVKSKRTANIDLSDMQSVAGTQYSQMGLSVPSLPSDLKEGFTKEEMERRQKQARDFQKSRREDRQRGKVPISLESAFGGGGGGEEPLTTKPNKSKLRGKGRKKYGDEL